MASGKTVTLANGTVLTGEAAANYGVSAPPAATTSGNGSTSSLDAFTSALQKKLMSQSDLISSSNTNIESKINEAIKGVQTSVDKSNLAVESAYSRERAFQEGQGNINVQDQLEGRTGFATQMIAFRNLVETTDKNLKDLDQRKQELILQNDAAGASKIAELQLSALSFQQQAQQQTFTNLLSMGSFGLQAEGVRNQARAQDFNEKQAMSNVALQFGLTVQPGDTIDSITSRAAPFATERQQLELDQIRANIAQSKAQTQLALSNAADNKPLSALDIDAIAQAAVKNPAVLGLLKNADDASSVINKMSTYEYQAYKDEATTSKQGGVSKSSAQAAVNADGNTSATDKLAKLKAIEEVYGNAPEAQSSGGIFGGFFSTIDSAVNRRTIGYDRSGRPVYGRTGQRITGYDASGNPIIK